MDERDEMAIGAVPPLLTQPLRDGNTMAYLLATQGGPLRYRIAGRPAPAAASCGRARLWLRWTGSP